ncbi:Flagellar basal-body rod protein FlgB [Liberibacter crescens BT-1]|uniref:Flagellar basal body rod protein FlgB n=1 Tax=Liberibacter crescens (strain BT-1) TaxID=1215343 RepID=L0EUX8_LIBCB|nr:flagellar basal body protein [Liberibacter crescens]AGA64191.1 Flagellar basal-body rod protein FlgB [Liberibacter crescens BT-1]AMC12448.1 flagellar basal body rod protein FlgB [Liberibacter crescens]
MQTIRFFEFASKHAEWLSVRQKVVSENIANASTPHYRAQDITPFQESLGKGFGMACTHKSHINRSENGQSIKKVNAAFDQEIGVQVSGNTVGLTNELMKSGEIKHQYELNTLLVSRINTMTMLVVKG